jgi:hypothetical protein
MRGAVRRTGTHNVEVIRVRRLWRDYSLSIVLFVLFFVSWVGQTAVGWLEFAAEQQAHGQVARWFGQDGYVWTWAEATLENWQSEFLQLLTFVVLTSFLLHRGSHESKDGDDELRAKLDRIERRLAELASQSANGHGRTPDRLGVEVLQQGR